ncbi:MAG: histidine--tRNA ligase [Clostridiales bacterium]|nr:histidine--tRNA ligase [Clostridiales bacterium]
MERVKPRTLTGFMELLPNEQIEFEKFIAVLRDNYIKYGFYPLDTPVLESAQVLLAKGGGETEKQIYRFKKGDTDLAMRFDLTVPLAKYVALNYNELNFPFKRYQIGKVYRGERAQKGRYREFYQADIDIIGDGELSIIHDAEIPAIISDIFTGLGIHDFKIRMNNRKLLSGFFELLGFSDKAEDILRSIDKLEKIGADKVTAELAEYGVSPEDAGKILDFVATEGSIEEKLAAAEKYAQKSALYDKGLAELKEVVKYADAFGVSRENYTLDFSIARGLDYYTGTVYETQITSHPEFGSVCSGGRYDNLAGFYTDRDLPGVGISIGATRLFTVLKENGFFDFEKTSPIDALIIPMTENIGYCINIMNKLRNAGVKVQTYFEDKKLKKKMTYANRINVPYAVIIGDNEIAENKLALKNLETGEQIICTAEEAAKIINA